MTHFYSFSPRVYSNALDVLSMLESLLKDSSRPQAEDIFRSVENNEFNKLLQTGVTQVFKKGEIIFKEHGIPAGIFYMRSGHVKKFKTTPLGSEKIFYISGPGEMFGYHAVFADERYSDSAAAIEDCKITFIPKNEFQKAIHESQAITLSFLKALAHEFRIFKISIATQASSSVKERVAINLLILDDKFRQPDQNGWGSKIILSRSDLASMVGTAKENLVRILGEFKATNLIKIADGHIQIIDREGVVRQANLIGKL